MTDSIGDTGEIQSEDISSKQIGFLSISSNLSVNALHKMLTINPHLINMTDEKRQTFLSYAIKRNNNQIINLIVDDPLLDLNYQDKNGNTYLHMSVIHQNINLIKSLLEKNININSQNNDGNTALHFAYYINNIRIINLLKKNKNLDVNIENKQGLIAENVIPTNDIDKIAGYEVGMNFDINIYDELKYNNINEESIDNIMNNNHDFGNKKEIQNKDKKLNAKNNNKQIDNKVKENKNNQKNNKNKDKIQNTKKIINKNTKNTSIQKNTNGKINNNCNKKNNNKNDDGNDNDNDKEFSEEYKDLIPIPFNSGRKLSIIDKIYNENDRFFRKESENYALYAELLNSNRESYTSPLKINHYTYNNNLSNIMENNNTSQGNSNNDNIIFDNTNKNNSNSSLTNSNKNNNSLLINNSSKNNSNNNITMMQNILINCSNKSLLDFLMQINLQKYYIAFNSNGYDDINMIIENYKKGKHISDEELKKIGIIRAGDRAKILIRIQEKANLFDFNLPKSVYYITYNLEKIEDDGNVFKLYEWLGNIRLEDYLKNFLNNGYFSVDLLFVQYISINPLNDEILKNDIGIDKLGYRARILNKIKEDITSYSNKLKNSVVTFNSIENQKICNECAFC